jgi:VanZ family protein
MNRKILTVLTLLWMVLIFMMSGADDHASRAQSGSICRVLCETFVEGFEELSAEEQQALEEALSFPVRKSAHFAEYAILGLLLTLTAGAWFPGGLWGAFPVRTGGPLVIGTLYAVTDEIHQLFVPGRAGQIRDVLIDACGVFAGIILINRLCSWRAEKKRRSENGEK